MRPRILDTYCKAGGTSRGYADAGFDVVGVDIEPQPNYPYPFIQASALDVLADARFVATFDAVAASPPCQDFSDLRHRTGKAYPRLIEPTRGLLLARGLPYIIENVEGAPLHDPVVLCGTMFPGLRVLRHRLFETNWDLAQPQHPPGRHPLVFTHDKRKRHYGQLDQNTSFVQVTGGGNCTVANACDAMGIDWMTKDELNEAIPPAYTRYIGAALLQHLQLPLAA